MRKKFFVGFLIGAVLLAGITYAGIEFYKWWNDGRLIQQEAEEIANDFLLPEESPPATDPPPEESEEPEEPEGSEPEEKNQTKSSLTLDYENLVATNHEAIGWIHIEGTGVNYPVMQTTDNSKYMDVNIYGQQSSAGTPFLDCTNSLEPMDSNLIIYGHNMGVGRTSAFSTLTRYKNQSQWNKYPVIELNLKGQTATWRIFAVLEFNVDDMASFNYTTHNFLTAEEKAAFIAEAKQRASYDTGIEVSTDDHILTLSTCDRGTYGTKGRIVVMAVQE